jgi:hypothetical protein
MAKPTQKPKESDAAHPIHLILDDKFIKVGSSSPPEGTYSDSHGQP